jgi:RNA polymerase sigma-70 factor, ECF subfamily
MQKTCSRIPDVSPDDHVIRLIRGGETSLYSELMLRYRHRLYPILQRMLRNEAEVEDTMQSAHLRALTHLNQFSGQSSFFTWLTRIMINEAVSRARKTRRHRQLEDWYFDSGSAAALMSMPLDPEQQILEAELNASVLTALDQIPQSYSAVFRMRTLEELSTAEVARSLGISEQCVKCRLHRARKLLQRRLPRSCRATLQHAGVLFSI